MLEDNIESLSNLEENLKEYGKSIDDIPLVIQYNKRDLPDAMDLEELHRHLNKYKAPFFTAIATQGQGVLETLTGICKLVISKLKRTAGILETEKDTFEDEIGKIGSEGLKKPDKKILLPEDYSDEALKMLDVFGTEKSNETSKFEEVEEELEPVDEDILILSQKAKELIKEKEEIKLPNEVSIEEKTDIEKPKEEDIIMIETESIGVKGSEIELPLKITAGGKEKAIKIRLKIEVGED
jgi:GTPase involved in cell partitioning and DNA repair